MKICAAIINIVMIAMVAVGQDDMTSSSVVQTRTTTIDLGKIINEKTANEKAGVTEEQKSKLSGYKLQILKAESRGDTETAKIQRALRRGVLTARQQYEIRQSLRKDQCSTAAICKTSPLPYVQ